MKILVACEYSGRVREAFRAKGHEAWSCDILPDESGKVPTHHLQGDVCYWLDGWEAAGIYWDMIIGFPPCTDLSCVGANLWQTKANDGRMAEAMALFMRIAMADCERIAIENPQGVMSRVWRKADQYVEPYWFGEPFKKKTGLWLKGLPLLKPTNMVEPTHYYVSSSSNIRAKTNPGALKLQTNKTKRDPHKRSLTFQGLANAMAEQWG